MNKLFSILTIVLVLSLIGCSSESKYYYDGVHVGKSEKKDESGGYSKIVIVVSAGRIKKVEFNMYDRNNIIINRIFDHKVLDEKEKTKVKKLIQIISNYEKQLLEKQLIDEVELIAGTEIVYNAFVETAKRSLRKLDT